MSVPDDALVGPLDHPIRLPVFEGPLDLLLFLIRKNELDVYDIPIGEVTRQYLSVLRSMEKLSLEIAGEFFVMAATLMHIKSRMLLPRQDRDAAEEGEEEDPGEDPRWELVQQLLEYKKFKEAAGALGAKIEAQHDLLPREVGAPLEDTAMGAPLKPGDRIELWNVFNNVLRRLSERIQVGAIEEESFTVADRMEHLLGLLRERDAFTFLGLFEKDEEVPLNKLVATFLALLELTRLRKLQLEQTEDFGDIACTARDESAEPPATEEALPSEDVTGEAP